MASTPLTETEVQAIVEHCTRLRDGVSATYNELRALPKSLRTSHVEGQILYYKHQISTLNWAIRTAKQRGPGGSNVNRESV